MTLSYILGAALVVTLVLGGIFIINRLRIAGISEAIIVAGSKKGANGDVKVITPGGKAFVLPIVQKATSLSLRQRKVELNVDGWDQNKIPITVRGVAMFKVGSSESDIRAAGERFEGGDLDIDENTQEVLLGSLRAIIGQMTVEELVSQRDVLAARVTDNAKADLGSNGLILDSLQVSEIIDSGDYIRNLGIPESEKAAKEARIARANAEKEANDVEIQARTAIAEKNKELAVREAELRAETERAGAISNAAGPLAKAERDQEIANREQGTAEQLAILREKQLDTEIRKPADARLYDTQKAAEASKAEQVAQAEADAAAIRLKGEAEAESIRLVGEAEAEALLKRAEALKQFNEAAVTELLINKLPEVARELAAPIAQIKDLTVISTEGANALPKMVADNFGQLDVLVKSFTGSSITELVGKPKEEVNEEDVKEVVKTLPTYSPRD